MSGGKIRKGDLNLSSELKVEIKPALKPDDVAKLLSISVPHAYNLMRSSDFPTIRIGRSMRVMPEDFLKWKNKYLEARVNDYE